MERLIHLDTFRLAQARQHLFQVRRPLFDTMERNDPFHALTELRGETVEAEHEMPKNPLIPPTPEQRTLIAHEFADILSRLFILSNFYGIDLFTAYMEKMDEVEYRYPVHEFQDGDFMEKYMAAKRRRATPSPLKSPVSST